MRDPAFWEMLATFAQRAAVVGGVVLLALVLGLGLMAVRQRSLGEDEDAEAPQLWTDQTVHLPRYRGRRRRPRGWVRPVRHRRPVATPRVPSGERPTVEMQVIDPPQGDRR